MHFSYTHTDSSPIEVQRTDALYDFLQMPTNAGRTAGWGFGHTRVPSRTPSFPHDHHDAGRCGWAFAVALRREVLATSNTAAATLPPSRRCRVNGALLDELLLVTGRANELLSLFPAWRPSHRLRGLPCTKCPRRKENTCALIGKAKNHRATCTMDLQPLHLLALKLNWATLFSYRLFKGKHINLLELESLISLLRRVTREGAQARRLLVLVDSRVVLGAVIKGSRKIDFLLRKLGFCCLADDIALHFVWVPTLANPADAPSQSKPIESWYASLPKLPPPPTAVFASAHALSPEDSSLRTCYPAVWAAADSGSRSRSSSAFSYSEMKPAHVEKEASRVTSVGESNSSPPIVRHLSREGLKKRMEGRENRRPHVMLALPRSHHHSELVQCAAWTPPQWDRNQTTGETNCCTVHVTSKDVLDQSVRILCEDGTSWCKTFCPPQRNVMTWPSQSWKNISRVRDVHGLEDLAIDGLNELGHLCFQYLRTCFAVGSLGPGQAGTLMSGLTWRNLADLEDRQSVFRTLWRVHRSWSLAIPAEFRTPVSHEIVLRAAISAWLHNVPELSLLTLLSFHCLLRPAEASPTSMVRRENC